MCAVVRLRALMARQAARLITNPPIEVSQKNLANLTLFSYETNLNAPKKIPQKNLMQYLCLPQKTWIIS
jgi:hypothetical protein